MASTEETTGEDENKSHLGENDSILMETSLLHTSIESIQNPPDPFEPQREHLNGLSNGKSMTFQCCCL